METNQDKRIQEEIEFEIETMDVVEQERELRDIMPMSDEKRVTLSSQLEDTNLSVSVPIPNTIVNLLQGLKLLGRNILTVGKLKIGVDIDS